MVKSVVVTLTDELYFNRAYRTIIDIRTRGEWTGDLVLITIGFTPSQNFLDFYNIINKRFEHLDLSKLLEQYTQFPLKNPMDDRHLTKLAQWNKFYVFDEYFTQWDKVIFLDAGLRVFDKITILDNLDYEGKILAPDDSASYQTDRTFERMLDLISNENALEELLKEYPKEILNERYFLNCIWVYDTKLIKICNINEMIETMNKYPICRCNEMTIMNLLFTMKYKVWKPFPEFVSNGKRLFGWCENDRDYGQNNTWRNFCFLKYPYTINLDCN